MPPRIAKLAGLGAFAACAGIVALLALLIYFTRPTPSSGLDQTERTLTWMAMSVVLLALLGVHLMIGRRLLALSKGEPEPV
jgi:hypothetical protein